MQISFSPIRLDTNLSVERWGDALNINGETFDFEDIAEGDYKEREEIDCAWITGPVCRKDGILQVTLVLPHGPNPSEDTLFPEPVLLEADGPVSLPGCEAQGATLSSAS